MKTDANGGVICLARGTKGRVLVRWTEAEIAFVREHYKRLSSREMAAQMGRTPSQVRNFCWKFDLDVVKKHRCNGWSDDDLALLRDAYGRGPAGQDIDLEVLAASIGRLKSNVCRKAGELGLTNLCRPKIPAVKKKGPKANKFATTEERLAELSKRTIERLAVFGHPRGMLGKKHTPEVLAVLAERSAANWSALSEEQIAERSMKIAKTRDANMRAGKYINERKGCTWKAAWREVGGQRCFFRSRWEANYARYLEWLRVLGEIQSWEHEPRTFWFEGIKRGCVSYLPDFRVIENNGTVRWHEVKGWMDARSATVLKRMAKYHPNEVMVLIRKKEYYEIKRKVSTLILGWEQD